MLRSNKKVRQQLNGNLGVAYKYDKNGMDNEFLYSK
jgi:hypothetical protein